MQSCPAYKWIRKLNKNKTCFFNYEDTYVLVNLLIYNDFNYVENLS